MCGILGGNNRNWNYKDGIERLYHRGPDGIRIKELDNFTFAFARLSIVDLSDNGMQPMTSADGNITVVFNGEIYGYSELKKILSTKYSFLSDSDTEVVLYAYLEYGEKFIDLIDGMFSIAIYDQRNMQVKLYRDRVGIKPLYYYIDNHYFAFASELKALQTTCTDIKFEIDYTALYDYLFYGYIPEPKSMYKRCFKLEPAHMLTYDIEKKRIVEKRKYWKLRVNSSEGCHRTSEELGIRLSALLGKSVKEQLVADVPVGTFLSGGVDSSIISYLCNMYSPNIHTFTIGFEGKKYDETRYAQMLVEKYSLNNTNMILTNVQTEKIKGKMQEWYDEPFADTSAYPSYAVSELAKRKVTVVLTGDGGDELFGGYQRYNIYYNLMKKKKIDSEILNQLVEKFKLEDVLNQEMRTKYINCGFKEYLPLILLNNKKHAEVYRKEWGISKDYDVYWHLRKYYIKELPILTRLRYLDFKTYLPGDILTKIDRVSMVNSLEARVPFLSRKVIEFAFSLSAEDCYTANSLKKILKDAFYKEIPKQILYHAKRGFSVPPTYIKKINENVCISENILKNEWGSIIS
ncbi:MAG: asparagine synthase (glutamine-hydrolyzing) [Clostridiales bacterium]|nr:asparagine synthase (glutamine-hydrolyzing) [Clostridiales bacterium]